MRVLVIDDDPDIREVIDLVLASEGYGVELAVDGLDALERLRAGRPPSVILLDMMMPRLDGEGLMRILKSDVDLARIPVIVISGHQSAREKAEELGAAGCLVKPLDLDTLLSAVRRFDSSQQQAPP